MDATWCAADAGIIRTRWRGCRTSATANSSGAVKSSAALASYTPKSSPANDSLGLLKILPGFFSPALDPPFTALSRIPDGGFFMDSSINIFISFRTIFQLPSNAKRIIQRFVQDSLEFFWIALRLAEILCYFSSLSSTLYVFCKSQVSSSHSLSIILKIQNLQPINNSQSINQSITILNRWLLNRWKLSWFID